MADLSTPSPDRFAFEFDPAYRIAALPFAITPGRAHVDVDHEQLDVRFGFWRVRTPLTNVVDTEISGPFRWFKTMGPAHLSLADRGLTCATNGQRGICIRFAVPVRGMDPLGLLRHPGLTVTVADPEGLARALEASSGAPDATRTTDQNNSIRPHHRGGPG